MTTAKDKARINNALISCHDKTGLKYFASELVNLNPNVRIYCSSGTFKELEKAVPAANLTEISEYTGIKEMPSGLVKTLHPKIHSGILADVNDGQQRKYLEENNAVAFDLVVVNLYPFADAADAGSIEKARTNMDIGGVSLIESAAKNFLRVVIVVSPVDYERLLEELRRNGGYSSIETRIQLAKTAMDYLSAYITNISNYYDRLKTDAVKKEYKVE
ncbi:hypothetical protein HYU40_01675 [Candidatus Woesearchaeota archaeon]|nr:hypothetical protein [Candidatus Woesearchaeota archaeon]